MFINDRPIDSKDEDFLGRYPFAAKLSKALYDWKEEESLVISLTGKWGSGKSSVFNLVRENIKTDKSDTKPTIINFNPWMFSNINNLSNQFFNELAKELNIKNNSKKDKKLAEKILYYSELLNIIPSDQNILNIGSILAIGFGVFGIVFSDLIGILNLSTNTVKIMFFAASILSLIAGLLRKISDIFKYKAKLSTKSINSLKKEIHKSLRERNKKLVIFIDDIDRLTPEEIKEIFKLIRVNADFPNTIYVLAYDNEIIERSIETKGSPDGKSYIDKIVQVNFDLPRISNDKVSKYLFLELNRVLSLLPKSYENYFDKEYWSKTYHSGYKYFFKTLRDVKRYISSLEFNLSLLYKENSMEVNPIDFIAIEAIRVFSPSFYSNLKIHKELFAEPFSGLSNLLDDESKKKELAKIQFQNIIELVKDQNKENVKSLIFHLFPDLGKACNGNISFISDNYTDWRRNLNVCSPIHFDTYFSLVPGGDEDEISQFKIDKFIYNIDDLSYIEKSLFDYLSKNKLNNFIDRLRDYANDHEKINDNLVQNLVQAFFNISDKLDYQASHVFDIAPKLSLKGIVNNLLSRFKVDERYLILQDIIKKSSSITLPFEIVSYEVHLSKEKDNKSEFSNEQIATLQGLCVNKIESIKANHDLLKLDELSSILQLWSEWSDGTEFDNLINTVKINVDMLLSFVDKFFTITTSNLDNRFSVKQNKELSVKTLRNFIDPKYVVDKFEIEKENDSNFFRDSKDLIEKIIDNLKNEKER